MTMRPSEAYEAIADILTQAVKRPFRDEPITPAEWDVITDKILQFAAEQNKEAGGQSLTQFVRAAKQAAEAMKRIGGAK